MSAWCQRTILPSRTLKIAVVRAPGPSHFIVLRSPSRNVARAIWPLLVIGALSIPIGLAVFKAGERYAKQHGKLKRSG